MPDTIEPRCFLVVRIDHIPWSFFSIRVFEHQVLGLGVFYPTLARLYVHRAELPALDWVPYAILEATLLFFVVDREPILDEIDAGAN